VNIAVLGLGRMGQALAGRLLEAGHAVSVWNRSAGKADALVERGAKEAGDPTEAIEPAEVVVSVLSNDQAVRELAFGEGGLQTAMGSRVYANSATVSAELSEELGRAYENFVALPILGAPQAVASGNAVYLAGGPAEAIDRLGPMLASLTSTVKRFGHPGQAAAAKLAVNLMLLSSVATLAEAFAVGRSGGLSEEELRDLLGESPTVPPGLKNRFEAVLTGEGPTWWTTRLGHKDARLALELADSAGATVPVARAVTERFREAEAGGLAEEDIAAVGRMGQPSPG